MFLSTAETAIFCVQNSSTLLYFPLSFTPWSSYSFPISRSFFSSMCQSGVLPFTTLPHWHGCSVTSHVALATALT
jgi:hypothetical protein